MQQLPKTTAILNAAFLPELAGIILEYYRCYTIFPSNVGSFGEWETCMGYTNLEDISMCFEGAFYFGYTAIVNKLCPFVTHETQRRCLLHIKYIENNEEMAKIIYENGFSKNSVQMNTS